MNEVNRRMATDSCTQRPASRAMRVSGFGRRRHSMTSRAQMRRPSYVNHLRDGDVPIDNNYVENRIRPWAMACS
jgi:hypothetical protein